MKHVPDFVKGATNVYRTRDYIVKQVIGIKIDCEENNAVEDPPQCGMAGH